jgi:hypothetical protein
MCARGAETDGNGSKTPYTITGNSLSLEEVTAVRAFPHIDSNDGADSSLSRLFLRKNVILIETRAFFFLAAYDIISKPDYERKDFMKRKVCFMFINATITEPVRTSIDLGQGEMLMVGVGSYESACGEARKLADEGVILIELCGGFGIMGQAKVAEAVAGKVRVGAVRFDIHPGYDNASGDERWIK